MFWQWAWVVDDFGHRHFGRYHRWILGWLCDAVDWAEQQASIDDV